MIHKSNDDSFVKMQSVGGALRRALHANSVEMGGDNSLKSHPGKALTVLQLGMEKLRGRANTMGIPSESWSSIEDKAYNEYMKGEPLCESPIERSMLAALITGAWSGFGTIPPRVHNGMDKEEMLPKGDVLIVPQMAFLRYRLDFAVVLEVSGRQQIVAVECDGADFHNDYKREKLRVDYLKSWGIPVFKFKGSEIHAEPIAAAHKAILSICMWRDSQ